MIEEVRKDDMCFGFVIGWAVDKFAGFAEERDGPDKVHFAGNYATDAEAAAAVLRVSMLLHAPMQGNA